jgi:CRP-like cAMP-binding protein
MRENIIVASLPAAEKERLKPFLEPVSLITNQTLITQGEPIPAVWFPDDCVTSTLVTSTDGTTIEVGLMGTEGMVGLSLMFGVERSNATVICQVPGRATRLRADVFKREVVEKPGTMFKILQRYINAFMGMIAQSAACNSTHPLEERCCRWILMTHDRVQRDEFPLTHDFLAYMLGVRRPTISLAASVLKRAGFIDYTRGTITIRNRAGLEATTCECYEIINRQMATVFADTPNKRRG